MEGKQRGFVAVVEEEDVKVRASGRTRGAGALSWICVKDRLLLKSLA